MHAFTACGGSSAEKGNRLLRQKSLRDIIAGRPASLPFSRAAVRRFASSSCLVEVFDVQ